MHQYHWMVGLLAGGVKLKQYFTNELQPPLIKKKGLETNCDRGCHIYIASDDSFFVHGQQPEADLNTRCFPVADIEEKKSWQCFGKESGRTVVRVNSKSAIKLEVLKWQTVSLYYGMPERIQFPEHERWNAREVFAEQKERGRLIRQEAKIRSELTDLILIQEQPAGVEYSKYIWLERMTGIKAIELKENEEKYRFIPELMRMKQRA